MTLPTRIILPLLMLAGRALADDTDSSDVPIVYRILHYWPNKVAAIIFAALYLIVGVVIFWHVGRYRDWWGLCLLSASCMAAGYAVRFVEVAVHDSVGFYIFQTFFILCAPAAFLAFNYTLYGRVVVRCLGREFSIIRPERVARIFVISDVTTFLAQSAGNILSASTSASTNKRGNDLALAGLIGQGVSYAFFLCVAFTAHIRYIRASPVGTRYQEEWWKVIWLLYFSSVPIIIRSVYRIIEFTQGNPGYLIMHEVYFYCLDGLPLWFAVTCYAYRWPSRYITERSEGFKMSPRSSTSV
ncbi:RTA1-domain-containing protein [Heliocybe sulcata]|uniref:RTA1-domain-containing protein n=1 Tax=Heliocybe sulcata TaxID=5364 RepID=A0A5C3MUP5_9AGAM|nr:RTA1-domain-containing protein [Heliocybe sulcata]